jgi:dienelactone hydrolase
MMFMNKTYKSIDINGYNGKQVKNTLISIGNKTKLAIIFPGVGYTCQMPLLYYTTSILLENGYDAIWIEYDYKNEKFESSDSDEQLRWLNFDAEASHNAATAGNKYKKILLVGKSLGTFALSHLNETTKNIEKTIWLTPLLGKSGTTGLEMYGKIKKVSKNSLFIIGTEDPHYDEGKIEGLKKRDVKFVSVIGANHSMEIENDSFKSLKVLEQVTKEIKEFLE